MKSAQNIAFTLKLLGFDVFVLTSRTKKSKKYEEIEGVKIFRTWCFHIPEPFNYVFTPILFSRLNSIIRNHNPHLFIISKYFFFTSFTVIPLKILRRKTIFAIDTFPGVIWFSASETMNFILRLYFHSVGKVLLRISDKNILLNEELLKPAKRYGIKRSILIRNGILRKALDRTINNNRDLNILRENWKQIITFIGRMDKIKGYHLVLEISKFSHNKESLFLMVGPYSKKKVRKWLELPNVLFLGYKKDIREIFKISDILLAPSLAEGMPNAVMEAMYLNVPVIGASVGGIPLLIKDGKSGLLFQRGNIHEMDSKLSFLISNKELQRKISINAKKTILEKYDFEKNLKRAFTTVLREIF